MTTISLTSALIPQVIIAQQSQAFYLNFINDTYNGQYTYMDGHTGYVNMTAFEKNYARYQFLNNNFNGSGNLTLHGGNILVNFNTADPPSSIAGTGISIRGADNQQVRVATSSYGIGSIGAYANRMSRGTMASPSAVSTNDILFSVEGWGYAATGYTSGPRVFARGYAADTWNDTYTPTYFAISTTDKLVPTEKLRIYDNELNVSTNATFHGNVSIEHKLTVKSLNVTNNLYVTGNFSAKRPYAMFSDNTTQVIGAPLTKQAVNFSTVEDSYLINIDGKQNITVAQSGDYLIEVSAIMSVDTPNKHMELWVEKVNSTGHFQAVPRSNTKMEIPTASTEIPLAVPFIIDLLPTDKFRVVIGSDDAGSSMVYTAATGYSPETPSIIMTMSKISETTP